MSAATTTRPSLKRDCVHSLTTAYYPAMTNPLFSGVFLVDLVKVPTSLPFPP